MHTDRTPLHTCLSASLLWLISSLLVSGSPVTINYKDSEGDLICIMDQEDLDIACAGNPLTDVSFFLTTPGDFSVY